MSTVSDQPPSKGDVACRALMKLMRRCSAVVPGADVGGLAAYSHPPRKWMACNDVDMRPDCFGHTTVHLTGTMRFADSLLWDKTSMLGIQAVDHASRGYSHIFSAESTYLTEPHLPYHLALLRTLERSGQRDVSE